VAISRSCAAVALLSSQALNVTVQASTRTPSVPLPRAVPRVVRENHARCPATGATRSAFSGTAVPGPASIVTPTPGVSPASRRESGGVHLVLDVLAAAVRSGTLALVASHDPRVIESADVVVRMRSGRIESPA